MAMRAVIILTIASVFLLPSTVSAQEEYVGVHTASAEEYVTKTLKLKCTETDNEVTDTFICVVGDRVVGVTVVDNVVVAVIITVTPLDFSVAVLEIMRVHGTPHTDPIRGMQTWSISKDLVIMAYEDSNMIVWAAPSALR